MGANSKIEWTNATWNPVTGCTPISAGCTNCYARRMARRLAGRFGYPEAPHHFDVTLHPDRLEQPLRWRKPGMVFVCSMGDLFHESVKYEFLDKVFEIIGRTPRHTYQILTKRPERMFEFITSYIKRYGWQWTGSDAEPKKTFVDVFSNVWLGVTAENQQAADKHIPLLLQTPAAVRFVSCEPLLGPVDLWMLEGCEKREVLREELSIPVVERITELPGLDWVIAGGESGPNARPMHPDWARSLRGQCQAAGVPFFFKQWGEWMPVSTQTGWSWQDDIEGASHAWIAPDGIFCDDFGPQGMVRMARVGKSCAGRLLDGVEWNQMPGVD